MQPNAAGRLRSVQSPRALLSPVLPAGRIAFSPDGRLDAAVAGARGSIRFGIWLSRLSVRAGVRGAVATMCTACDGWAVNARSAEVVRMRLSASLTVVGALLLMSGVLMALVGEAMRLNSPRDGQAFVRAGEILAAAGLACGLAVMLAVAVGATRRRPAGL